MSNPDLEKLAERVIKYSIKTGQLLWCNHLCFSVLLYLAIRAVSSRAEGLRASKQLAKSKFRSMVFQSLLYIIRVIWFDPKAFGVLFQLQPP